MHLLYATSSNLSPLQHRRATGKISPSFSLPGATPLHWGWSTVSRNQAEKPGVYYRDYPISAKRLEILKEMVPTTFAGS